MNLRNYIWGYKPVIGSNECFDSKVSEKVTVFNTSRAQFTVMYNDETFFVDSESALSIILQYVYYRCFKTESISYDTFPFEMKAILENSKPVAIAIPSYYRDSHIRGLEMALYLSQLGQAVFIPEGIAIALDYGYVKAMKNQFPEEGKVVLFCDMGELATTVTIVRYTNVLFCFDIFDCRSYCEITYYLFLFHFLSCRVACMFWHPVVRCSEERTLTLPWPSCFTRVWWI